MDVCPVCRERPVWRDYDLCESCWRLRELSTQRMLQPDEREVSDDDADY